MRERTVKLASRVASARTSAKSSEASALPRPRLLCEPARSFGDRADDVTAGRDAQRP